jgi:hypothetical protein
MSRAHCYGNERHVEHVKRCRPGRPLCRWARAKRDGVCVCGAYTFPHRYRSGACRHGNWEALEAPLRRGVEL